jgi:hypothetical protein
MVGPQTHTSALKLGVRTPMDGSRRGGSGTQGSGTCRVMGRSPALWVQRNYQTAASFLMAYLRSCPRARVGGWKLGMLLKQCDCAAPRCCGCQGAWPSESFRGDLSSCLGFDRTFISHDL